MNKKEETKTKQKKKKGKRKKERRNGNETLKKEEPRSILPACLPACVERERPPRSSVGGVWEGAWDAREDAHGVAEIEIGREKCGKKYTN